jgi:uncharacterized protein (DUF58 family)
VRGGRAQLAARRALAVAAAGATLVLVAFVFAAGPLFVPGVALCVIGALAPLWVLWSVRGARVRRILVAERVTEGDTFRATIEVRRPLSPDGWGRLEVVDALSGSRLRLGAHGSPLQRSRVAEVRVTTSFARRGEHHFEPPQLIARDPLELAQAGRAGDGSPQTVLVLPRTEPIRWRGAGRGARLSGVAGAGGSEALAASELEGLRPYRPGTPASRIHWPALARGHGLIERRLQADADRRPLVVLDPRVRGHDPAPLDAAVRATASIVLELARAGGCGLLLPGQARATAIDAELVAWPAVYARLAVIGTAADPVAATAPTLTTVAGRGGALIYVAAVCHQRLVASLSGAAGRGVTVLVVPDSELVEDRPRGVDGRATPALSVTGCRGFALGRAAATQQRAHAGAPAPVPPDRSAGTRSGSGAGG